MVKINDFKLIDYYIEKYKINQLFTKDMREFMELFLFKKNEHICRDGEDINYIFFFLEGKVKVYITLSNGKSLLNCFYQEFKMIGDIEIINLNRASTNVQAIEDTYCIGISLENARQHLINDAKFLRFLCNSLGEKLDRFAKNTSINLLYPLENRLASYILATGERIDKSGERVIIFNEKLTEISELLGTSYRHLLRTLNNLCLKGFIKKENNYFEVIDEVNLRKLAADLYL
ncbi:transcriptional regulator YeiL [Clostridium uliginosum]|uniref:cAMP-binding domain of CRP or a regulatory subunit of cAMP-dependent protein kinases n=1 Tax=Clostridium uliginosum TaxID=119641 RepID=A0A1I1N0T6_9CLOT|nr:transcriptional regulator YeiL [Clostridium uliginosum]SFC91035.1 cAMP-binding domain of CRP or a regulatory subunit of cAMP-dependent protein kinases [Clostridium uliginosum]